MTEAVTGKTLIALGYKPGPRFPVAIAAAEQVRADGGSDRQIRAEHPTACALKGPDYRWGANNHLRL